MTPLFSKLAKAFAADPARAVTETVGVAHSLDHFMVFECSQIGPMARDLCDVLPVGEVFPQCDVFLPWDYTWLEWRHGNKDSAAIMTRISDEEVHDGFSFSVLISSERSASGYIYYPIYMKVALPGDPLYGRFIYTFTGMELSLPLKQSLIGSLNLCYCFLACINKPNMFPRAEVPFHKGLKKTISDGARRSRYKPFEFRPWVRVNMPVGGHERSGDGVVFTASTKRGLQKVRAYLRRKPRPKLVFQHYRGDGAYGVCRSVKVAVPPRENNPRGTP